MSDTSKFYIENGVLIGCRPITDAYLKIPEGVTAIRSKGMDGVFMGNRNLKSVIIPEGVEEIGSFTFHSCGNLQKIVLPSTLKRIGTAAFYNCGALKSITIPEGVEEIGKNAFSNCSRLETVELPASLKQIPASMFASCERLCRITGMRDDVEMGDCAFGGCAGLADASGLIIVNRNLFGYTGKKLGHYNTLSELTVPDGVKKISGYAFHNCRDLRSVVIPEGVEEIGDSAFGGCGLKSVHLPDSIRKIGNSVFSSCNGLAKIRFSSCLEEIPDNAFNTTALTELEIPEGVHTIGRYAFNGCRSLISVRLPQTLKSLKSAAFACCGLEEITIPNGVEEMDSFSYCNNLKKINLPAALKKISGDGFDECRKIAYLRIAPQVEMGSLPFHKDVMIVADRVFADTSELIKSNFCCGSTVLATVGDHGYKLVLSGKLLELKIFGKNGEFNRKVYDNLLTNNEGKLSSALLTFAMLCRLRWDQELAEDKKQYYMEYVCKNVKKVAPYANLDPEDGLVATLEQIGALTARNKKTLLPLMGIGEVPVPKETKTEKASADPNVKMPAQLRKEWNSKKLEDGTLKLTSYKGTDTVVEVPSMIGKDRVTVIGKECMSASGWSRATVAQEALRKRITQVTIPEGVTTIEEDAFHSCVNLKTVFLPRTLKNIGQYAFYSCNKLRTIDVPEGASVEQRAFSHCPGLADEQGLVIRGGVLFGGYKGGDIVVPDYVTRVEEGVVFSKIRDLHSVVFPDGIKSLDHIFVGCDELQTVTIPPSVSYISGLHDGNREVLVRGYTGSEAERYVEEKNAQMWMRSGFVRFEAIGICQKEEFEIENGVLNKYNGNKDTLELAIIPDGVTEVNGYAFADCRKLNRIDFPDTVVHIRGGGYPFRGIPWERKQPAGPVYAGRVLLEFKYPDDICMRELIVREGTVEIADSACWGVKSLVKVVLPDGLQRIGDGAFGFCTNLKEMVVPASVTEIGAGAFEYLDSLDRCTGGVLQKTSKLSAKFKIFYTGDPEDTAWLVLHQAEQSWRKAIRAKMDEVPESISPTIAKMAQLIEGMEDLDKATGNRVAAFAQELCRAADAEALQALYQALKKKGHPAVKKMDLDDTFRECMEGGVQEDLSGLHPVEAMVVQNIQYTPAFEKVAGHIAEGIPYAGTKELCAPRVLAYIAYEYIRQYDPDSVKFVSMYATACTPYAFSAAADEAAAALDQQKLQEALLQLAEQYGSEYWLPYARYADERHTVSLLSQMREWDSWWKYAATGRKYIIIARSGLLLNDTKAAMIHLDKVGQLETYAAMRGTDADTIRDTVLADFGFDENREISYDLGGNTVIIRMDKALSLSIFDTNAGKTVKSIPKKGADPELHEKAKTAFSDLKKNIKKVITNRKKVLFADFLSGAKKEAEQWKQSYLGNPVLNSVAQLLVWDQGGNTFTLTANGAVDSSGMAYVITDEPICVAHPIEMRSEVSAWQEYFTAHGLKQPFEQVWEPAYDPAQILPDRYAGISLNVYRFANKEEHGITVWGLIDYSEDYGFALADCKMEQKPSEWRFVHGITDDATFTLGQFSFEIYTRRVNHIVYLFDKWTVSDRVAKDDISVAELLPSFTAAQIREFLELANQNGCTNCAALLLDYQNQNFGSIDPMAEFTLDL